MFHPLDQPLERGWVGRIEGDRVLRTAAGLVAFVTLGLDPESSLASAHSRASEVEERLRAEHPEIADVIVHPEP